MNDQANEKIEPILSLSFPSYNYCNDSLLPWQGHFAHTIHRTTDEKDGREKRQKSEIRFAMPDDDEKDCRNDLNCLIA